MFALERVKKIGDIRYCRICNRCIEENKYIMTVYGYKHSYYHPNCYKYFNDKILSNDIINA
jgi:hypothetical protein